MGPGPGGNDGFFEPQGLPQRAIAHADGLPVHKLGLAQKHINAQIAKALNRVVVANARPNLAHALHHGGKVNLDVLRWLNAKGSGGAHIRHDPR